MKRVIVAVIIIITIVLISSLALWDMQSSLDRIAQHASDLRESADLISSDEMVSRCHSLMQEWTDMEKRFLLYVRHDHLDSIMEHLTELSAFSEEQEKAELLSNLDAAIRMMEHLKESVTPSYRTLL